MLALVIDTSSAAVTAGLVEFADSSGPVVVAERVTVDARAHGELLAPSIKACLDQAGAMVGDLSAVVAGLGPGPFTGLRVGLVTAASIADAVGLPSYGVCSLDGIAAAHAEVETLLVAADARRKEIYWALYQSGRRAGEPAVGKAAELPPTQASAMAGAGARLYAAELGLPLLTGEFPTVVGLAGFAAERVLAGAPSELLVPLYLRRPDAVAPGERKPVTR
ncbi:MAG: tRNA (adenosine(37)-N6)-threonylcarbamoyltransferase complex dimerization subunit type 1 TsaB [Actinomycetota bacterium]|nr:tRNA (adenosine(37)-N6)-threonylcarbamoyltransferase complex dimerization subunit type 1 TsaB [Actinomycetota bacterium]MDQ2957392.1 tRNA (adenosine(37)-N6)-threonylcarbamoyltransferase complex dimerization subunit type 1 TsaB [Actinomycetota bacterium]